MKKIIFLSLFLYLCLTATAGISTSEKRDDKRKERFISSLMARMTIEEKIAQLNLVTPTAGTGPFKTKRALEKLQDGTAGNVLSLRGTAESIRKKAAFAEQTRHKIPLLVALDIIRFLC